MRKKLFAVIMSAMMMITFMPSMAFAAETYTVVPYSWNTDLTTVKVTNAAKTKTYTVSTTKELQTSTNKGMIKLEPQKDHSDLETATLEPMYYYDMSLMTIGGKLKYSEYDSSIVKGTGLLTNDLDLSANSSQTAVEFTFKAPTDDKTNAKATASVTKLVNTDVTIYKPNYNAKDNFNDQTLPLSVMFKYCLSSDAVTTLQPDGTATKPYRINSFAGKSIKITAEKVNLATLNAKAFKVGKTEVGTNGRFEVTYNGAEQQLAMANLPDVTVAYKLYNVEKGMYEEVANPVVKEAGTYEFTAQATKGTEKSPEVALTVVVKPAKIQVGFVPAASTFVEVYKGSNYKVRELVKFTNIAGTTTSDAYKATAAALVADKAAIDTWFDTNYEVKLDGVALAIAPKEGVVVAKLKNFDVTEVFSGTLKEVEIKKNDVTACNQTKTFHVKNAKALKAKKTFKLKGDTCDFGSLTYVKKNGNGKIAVAKDGKVTVKKGLKKGTYTVKIKVKAVCTDAASGYVTDTKTLKVKVVK